MRRVRFNARNPRIGRGRGPSSTAPRPLVERVRSVARVLGSCRGIVLLGLFLGLVPGTGTAGRADGAAHDRAGRPGARAADRGTGESAAHAAGTRAGLIVAFARLTGE